MLNKELENALNQAFKRAREQHHEFMTVEHLFGRDSQGLRCELK